jgi:hypothetical protein
MAFRFELPEELNHAVIEEAVLGVYCWTVSGFIQGSAFELFEIHEAWDETTANWNQRDASSAWNTPGGSFCSEPVDTVPIQSSGFYPEFDVTDTIQQWVDGKSDNQGFMLVNDSSANTGMKASEYEEYGLPYLRIRYSIPAECYLEADQDQDLDVNGIDLIQLILGYSQ